MLRRIQDFNADNSIICSYVQHNVFVYPAVNHILGMVVEAQVEHIRMRVIYNYHHFYPSASTFNTAKMPNAACDRIAARVEPVTSRTAPKIRPLTNGSSRA